MTPTIFSVLDDNKDICSLIEQKFKKELPSASIITYNDVNKFLAEYKEKKYPVVLMDFDLEKVTQFLEAAEPWVIK